MLPVQILLNNLLYIVSEMPIPLDVVDSEITEKPEHWDMRLIHNFMLVLGTGELDLRLSDLRAVTARLPRKRGVVPDRMVHRVARHPGACHLVLRTRRNPLRSRPHPRFSMRPDSCREAILVDQRVDP